MLLGSLVQACNFKLSLQSDTSIYRDCVSESLYAYDLSRIQVMAISLQCSSLSQIHSVYLLQAKNSMTTAYMGEVLTQVWLKSTKK